MKGTTRSKGFALSADADYSHDRLNFARQRREQGPLDDPLIPLAPWSKLAGIPAAILLVAITLFFIAPSLGIMVTGSGQ